MTPENVHKRTRETWVEVVALEEQLAEVETKRKSLKLQIESKMSKIRKFGTMTKEQMAQLTMFDDVTVEVRSVKSRRGSKTETESK